MSQKRWFEHSDVEDISDFDEPIQVEKVRVLKTNPEAWWTEGDIIDIDVAHHSRYPQDLYRQEEDDESEFNIKISWLDPNKRYFHIPSTDDYIAEDEVEPLSSTYQEQSMSKKRWFEANEVDPESGYIKEVPDEVETEPEDEFGFSDVAEYEPGSREAALAIAAQPNYVDALEAFSSMYDRNRVDIIKLIPHGSGTFEAWWTGALDPKDYEPGQLPSPEKIITKEDIDGLAQIGGPGDNGGEIFGLFMNSFYHSRMGWKMDPETLTYLVKRAMRYAATCGSDLEETFELEFPEIFGEMSEEDITETLKSPGIVARQVANAIRQRTAPER